MQELLRALGIVEPNYEAIRAMPMDSIDERVRKVEEVVNRLVSNPEYPEKIEEEVRETAEKRKKTKDFKVEYWPRYEADYRKEIRKHCKSTGTDLPPNFNEKTLKQLKGLYAGIVTEQMKKNYIIDTLIEETLGDVETVGRPRTNSQNWSIYNNMKRVVEQRRDTPQAKYPVQMELF